MTSATASPDLVSTLQQQLVALQERIRRLEDIEEIRFLHATYMDYVDKGWNGKQISPEGLAEVFDDEIVWGGTEETFTADQVSEGGLAYGGKVGAIEALKTATATFEMCQHAFLNEQIVVDGDTATGEMLNWVATRQHGTTDQWYLRASTNYVRRSVGWRIAGISIAFADTLRGPDEGHRVSKG